MCCWTGSLLVCLLAGPGSPEPVPATVYVNSPSIVLAYHATEASGQTRARLWVSRDQGATWAPAENVRSYRSALRYRSAGDGKYWFYIVLENDAGRSADPPVPGSRPHAIVVVDTARPTLQISAAEPAHTPDGNRAIRLRLCLVEENLGPAAVRVFYRVAADEPWRDGGPLRVTEGAATWEPPPEVGQQVDLRLVATDLAGNRAVDEVCGLTLPAALPSEARLAGSTPTRAPEPEVAPVEPFTVSPVPALGPTTQVPAEAATQPALEIQSQLDRLRRLAARYLAEGRLSLAEARLAEARQLAPDNPAVLVDLGSLLFRARNYDEADRAFQEALAAAPDHVQALEGLALVAATQRRYPEAREYLKRLLRLEPDSGRYWLRYGDVLHLLGNSSEAFQAWERVLRLGTADQKLRAKANKRLELFRPGQTQHR